MTLLSKKKKLNIYNRDNNNNKLEANSN